MFSKHYTLNWSKEAFLIKGAKGPAPWIYVLEDLHGNETLETFYR